MLPNFESCALFSLPKRQMLPVLYGTLINLLRFRFSGKIELISFTCTSFKSSPISLNFLGFLLRANLQPLQYMLQEQPKENDAPQVSGSSPWHAHVLLKDQEKWNFCCCRGKLLTTKKKVCIWGETEMQCCHLLLIDSTASLGESSMLPQSFTQFKIEAVSQTRQNAIPHQDYHNNAGCVTCMTITFPHQHQYLFLYTGSTNDLKHDGIGIWLDDDA